MCVLGVFALQRFQIYIIKSSKPRFLKKALINALLALFPFE
jgi:hypothetical protein